MPIYTLRFKSSRLSGVQLAQFEAENDQRGHAAALAWCNREPGRQFIGVTPFLTATAAELLGPLPVDAPTNDAIELPRRGPGRPPKQVEAAAV